MNRRMTRLLELVRDMGSDFGLGICFGQAMESADLEGWERRYIENIINARLRGVSA